MEYGPQYISTPPPPPHPHSHILSVYSVHWEGGGGQREGTVEGQQTVHKYSSFVHGGNTTTVHKLGRKYQPMSEWVYLQSIKSVENLPQTPFIGQFKRKADIKGFVSL